MAGNIGVELYLVVGKMKPVSPNFNLPTLILLCKKYMLNPYSANIKSANICLQHTFTKYNSRQYFRPYSTVCHSNRAVRYLRKQELLTTTISVKGTSQHVTMKYVQPCSICVLSITYMHLNISTWCMMAVVVVIIIRGQVTIHTRTIGTHRVINI